MRTTKVFLILIVLMTVTAATAYGWSDWLALKTQHFTVFYKPGHESEAKQVLQTMEFYRQRVENLCGNEELQVAIVIDDTGLDVNGFTDPLYSRIHLYRSEPDGWAGTENWWSLVGVHEYTHELSLTKTSGLPDTLTGIFGKFELFMPNILAPGWILEGITPYSESQLTPYQGRLNDGFFDAYIATRVKDGRFTSILDATDMPSEYQQEAIYTYGGEFFNYLAKTYGEENLTQFFQVNGGQLGAIFFTPALSVDRSAKKVFGKTFPELWEDWRQYETERFKDFRYEGEQLTNQGWEIRNLALNGGKLYYQRSYPVKVDAFSTYSNVKLMERDLKTGLEKTIISTTSSFTSALRVKDNSIYYATYEIKSGYANASDLSYGYCALLHQYDLATRKDRVILEDEIRGFEVLAGGRILYSKQQKDGFGSELYRYDPKAGTKTLLLKSNYLIDEIVADDQRLIVGAKRDWETNSIYRLDLEKQEFTPLVHTPYVERWLSLSGDRLFFTANYQKVSSVYCFDFTTGKVSRMTENGWVGNSAYDEAANQLYFVQLSSYGLDLYQKAAEFRDYQLPDVPATVPPVFTLDDSKITKGTYRDNLKTLAPKFWFPVIDTDQNKYGITITGGDAVMDFPEYSATITYNTKEEKVGGKLMVPINFFLPFQSSLTYSDSDDERSTKLMMLYPLVKRLSPGLSQLDVGTYVNYTDDYDGAELQPFATIGFQYPKISLNFKVSAPQSKLKNHEDRSGRYAELTVNQYLPDSEIRLAAEYINDPDNPNDDLFDEIRGYDDALTAREGKLFTVEYSRPLFKIRNGLWNPNIYFEDVIGTLFNDHAIPENGERQSSWGLELHMETKLVYSFIPLDWGCRFVRNDQGENKYELFFKTIY
jgi:hypothetical protein